MLSDALILIATGAGLALLFSPWLRENQLWQATVTPLASIIGSGFLVLGPILNDDFGWLAPLAMASLCLVAYLFGAAIRQNIRTAAEGSPEDGTRDLLERGGNWVLAFAYVVSVAYYLNLFGAFAVSLTPFDSPVAAKWVTTAIFALILIVGSTRGFGALERMEQSSVSLKLAIILGLIVGLGLYFGARAGEGALVLTPPSLGGWQALTLMFGLVVTVQGFETSRFLGNEYSADVRIRSMKLAQWTATVIYMAYIALLVYAIAPDGSALSETAIIGMTRKVAPVLPYMLVAAALAAQFSAAVADTAGAGGLVHQQSRGRIHARYAYALIAVAGTLLTWVANVFEIIAYASRAFAIYYAVEALIAAGDQRFRNPRKAWAYGVLSAFGVVMAVFGGSAE